jgi:hypothetical protein
MIRKHTYNLFHWFIERLGARLAIIALLLSVTGEVYAQNFVNTGQLNNTGTFRVKNGVSGLPDTVGGTFEYFGGSQNVQAVTYNILNLLGASSTKSTNGFISILQTVSVAKDVTYQLQSNSLLTLSPTAGRLTEEGIVLGNVTKTVALSASEDSTDFGGIGLSLKYSGGALGSTNVLRVSGTAPVTNALLRSFKITPTNLEPIKGALSFTYKPDEVPSGHSESRLELWRSIDGGQTWRRQHTTHGGETRQLVRSQWFIDGQWTAADSAYLIGPRNYEGDPDVILASQDSLRGRVNNTLNPFVAQISDIFGNPISNAKVKVTFAETPSEALGYQITDTLGLPLSDSTLYTDENGTLKIRVKLGNKKGYYRVRVRVDSVSTAEKIFIGYADVGATMLASVSEPTQDTIRSIVSPIVIEARDNDNLSVPDVGVKFEFVSWPSGATTHSIVSMDTITNNDGRAQAVVRLGEKVGYYRIKVSSSDLDSVRYFNIYAIHGKPALVFQHGAASAIDTIGGTISPLVYGITDLDSNAVPQRPVRIEFASKPSNSIGDSIIFASAATDTNGEVRFGVKLGSKVGVYNVRVVDDGISGSEKFYTFTATHGVPAQFVTNSVVPADTIGTVIPSLGVRVSDRGDNAIGNIPIQFAFASVPQGAEGAQLSASSGMTDSTGSVSIHATVGDKPGLYRISVSSSTVTWAYGEIVINVKPGVPMKLFAESGLNQQKEILQTLDSSFVVRVTDRASNPISNDTVFFTLTTVPEGATGYSLNQNVAITNQDGIASALLTLGNKVGVYGVTVTSVKITWITQQFEASALHGSARLFAYREGDSQQRPILTVLDTALKVQVADIGNNPVPNHGVRFIITKVPSGAYGFALGTTNSSDTTVTTDSLGVAGVQLKVGSKVGEYEVAAVTSLPDTIRFTTIATVGAPHALRQMAGNEQVGQIGDQLNPFVVRLQDVGENDIAGKQVLFSIIERPPYTSGDTLTTFAAMTDNFGMASTQLTLGLRGGVYKVRATSEGLDTVFNAKAILVFADVNNDNYQNIADVTAIIDHLLGKRLLKGAQFIKADIRPANPDGSFGDNEVDIYDLVAIIDSIQSGAWNPLVNRLATTAGTVQRSVLAKVSEAKGPLATLDNVASTFQITHVASRFTLENQIPVKGIQALLYLKHPFPVDTIDYLFPRAKMMRVEVKSIENVVRVLVYNMDNTPIEPDSGAIFRLPAKLISPEEIDSMRMLVSIDTNVAAMVPYVAQDISALIPAEWMLYQNYPNPFNSSTMIEFDVPEITGAMPRVAIQIFNILGQKVRTLEPGVRDVGRYKVRWDGRDEGNRYVASGVYFYRILAGEYKSTKKMVLIK